MTNKQLMALTKKKLKDIKAGGEWATARAKKGPKKYTLQKEINDFYKTRDAEKALSDKPKLPLV